MVLVRQYVSGLILMGFGMLSGFGSVHPVTAVSAPGATENEATIYDPEEVDCQRVLSDRECVLLVSGALQDAELYCQTA